MTKKRNVGALKGLPLWGARRGPGSTLKLEVGGVSHTYQAKDGRKFPRGEFRVSVLDSSWRVVSVEGASVGSSDELALIDKRLPLLLRGQTVESFCVDGTDFRMGLSGGVCVESFASSFDKDAEYWTLFMPRGECLVSTRMSCRFISGQELFEEDGSPDQ